jgi:hypothetical protein
MRREEWEQAIARAVVERTFRTRLLADPADALADYGLPESECSWMSSLRVRSLEHLTMQLARFTLRSSPAAEWTPQMQERWDWR